MSSANLSARNAANSEYITKNYEELISRLNSENLELKKSEEKLLETIRLKAKLEQELAIASKQLLELKNNDAGDAVIKEL